MIEKYKLDVLAFYDEKKAAGELSANLTNPTPANLRNECRMLFNCRCDNIDKRILSEFLAISFGEEISDLAVRKCDIDKFKPLNNFLKRLTNSREKNIELLAWLIDFRPRPFSNYWRLVNGKTDVLSKLSITELGVVEEMEMESVSNSEYNLTKPMKTYEDGSNRKSKSNQVMETDTEEADYTYLTAKELHLRKEVTLQYPSGVKLSVDASDISLIAQLVRL